MLHWLCLSRADREDLARLRERDGLRVQEIADRKERLRDVTTRYHRLLDARLYRQGEISATLSPEP